MRLTYFVTACNEIDELKLLLPHLSKHVDFYQDQLVILLDETSVTKAVEEYVNEFILHYDYMDATHHISVHSRRLKNDFSRFKNTILEYATGNFIVQIDSDEIPSEKFLKYLPLILEANPHTEMYWVARRNIVHGITPHHLKLWGWSMNDQGWINFPDFQGRIFKNNGKIRWTGHIHERLTGYEEFGKLPDNDFYLEHIKTIDRQEKQNSFYETLQS